MRAFFQLLALVTEDTNQQQKKLDEKFTIDDTLSTVDEYQSGVVTLDPAQSDYQVPFGSVTRASFVLIVCKKELSVKLDGAGSPAIPIRPILSSAISSPVSDYQKKDQAGIYFLRGRVNSIHVTNPDVSAATTFFYAIGGEAAA